MSNEYWSEGLCYGPLARYVKSRVAHGSGIPGTFPSPPRVSDPNMHEGTCVTHVPWCMSGSLTSGFLWSRRRKRSRHSRRMCNPQFYVSGKRPIWSIIWLRYQVICVSGMWMGAKTTPVTGQPHVRVPRGSCSNVSVHRTTLASVVRR